jgi:hypothetical protein
MSVSYLCGISGSGLAHLWTFPKCAALITACLNDVSIVGCQLRRLGRKCEVSSFALASPRHAVRVLIGFTLSEYRCTVFPAKSTCEANGQFFCIAWNTAGYTSQFSLIFATGGLFTVTLANITTKKRRRNAWKIVSALVGAHGESFDLCSLCSFPKAPGFNRSTSDCYDGHNCELASPFSSTPCAWDYL